MLREKTEEADMEQYLKRTIGGYTKQSFLKYLAVFRKQQMDTVETFNQNLQALYDEKKSMQGTMEQLRAKCTKAETELKNLSESITTFKLEDNACSAEDIVAMKSKISAYEGGLKKANVICMDLKRQNERLNEIIAEKNQEVEQAKQETQIQKEQVLTERAETKKQRDLVLELSGSVEEFREQIQYLKGIAAEEKTVELKARIDELIANNTKFEEIIAQRNVELAEKEKAIELLQQENKSIKQNNGYLSKTIEELSVQNEKYTLSNKEIAAKLAEAHQSTIQLITEKSEITVEKLIYTRKLEQAQQKISSLEMELRKQNKAEQMANTSAEIPKV
jgi:chromosome segregation ATPase